MGFASRAGLDDERKSLASTALASAEFLPMVVADQKTGFTALRMAVYLAHATEGLLALEQLEEQLVGVSKRLAALHPGKTTGTGPAQDALLEIVEIAAKLSQRVVPSDGWGRFSAIILRVADAWPGAIPLLRDVVGSVASAIHPEQAATVPETWIRLRSVR